MMRQKYSHVIVSAYHEELNDDDDDNDDDAESLTLLARHCLSGLRLHVTAT